MERSILVTGGAGWLGKGLTRELLRRGAERVCIFSRDEHKHAVMRQEFGDDERLRFFLGDIRDRERLRRAMQGVGVVIAAAALKRIDTAFYNPSELVKTNIIGTMNIIDAAQDARVSKVMAISTDKAAASISAYGHSKAMAESLILASNNARGLGGPAFSACRFGNVWGSTGSIVPKWRALVADGATELPVTDPDCTRYFMTLDQAVAFVLDNIAVMTGGELFVPELPAYRIADLAEAFGLPTRVLGLPEHEKRAETMGRGDSSDEARRMTVDELKRELEVLP